MRQDVSDKPRQQKATHVKNRFKIPVKKSPRMIVVFLVELTCPDQGKQDSRRDYVRSTEMKRTLNPSEGIKKLKIGRIFHLSKSTDIWTTITEIEFMKNILVLNDTINIFNKSGNFIYFSQQVKSDQKYLQRKSLCRKEM